MKALRLIAFSVLVVAVVGGGIVAYIYFNLPTTALDIDELDRNADIRLLFIGNSYTHYHDMPDMVAAMLPQAAPQYGDDILIGSHSPGGERFTGHLATIENRAENPPLRQALVSGSQTLRAWNAVILQEQSQIVGFGLQNASTAQSFEAAAGLHGYIQATGATTLLYMTWGRRDGDSMNPNVYPDFLTMQNRLTAGYDDLARRLGSQGGRVFVLPVGLAWHLVYLDEQGAGRNPLSSDSIFYRLYAGDGSHPSLAGSYLAAATITVAYLGYPVSDIDYVPRGLDRDDARYLREVADRLVLENALGQRAYPFNSP